MTDQNKPYLQDLPQNEEKSVELKDIKPGDILIFEGDDSIVSDLIKLFTKSTVTHSAIFVQNGEKAAFADSGECGIQKHWVTSFSCARGVHVRRLTKKGGFGNDYDKIVAPVINVANDYIKQGLPYPYNDLVLLAMILIYKNVSQNNLKQTNVIHFLRFIAAKLKTAIDKKMHKGTHSMVSSSFVYQCFLDASQSNPDLKLKVENSDIQPIKAKRSATLLDLYAEHAEEYNYNTKSFAKSKFEPSTDSIDEVLKELVDKENENHIGLTMGNALSHAIEEFLKVLMNACGIVVHSVQELIEKARLQQALFITPNDLYCRTTNTESVGVIHLKKA